MSSLESDGVFEASRQMACRSVNELSVASEKANRDLENTMRSNNCEVNQQRLYTDFIDERVACSDPTRGLNATLDSLPSANVGPNVVSSSHHHPFNLDTKRKHDISVNIDQEIECEYLWNQRFYMNRDQNGNVRKCWE